MLDDSSVSKPILKKCTGPCGLEKELTTENFQFFRDTRYKDKEVWRWKARCTKCITAGRREYKKQWKEKNKEKIKEKNKEYNSLPSTKERTAQLQKKNKKQYLIARKIYYEQNKEKIDAYQKQYKIDNKEELKKKSTELRKKSAITRLRKNISTMVWFALKKFGSSKNRSSITKYLNIGEIYAHIESLFEPWMNWNNNGVYRKEIWDDNNPSTWTWQLDHIIPHSEFYYTNMSDVEFQKCWALENLRPLNAKQNWHDGATKIRHKKKIS